jgi:hypothetical protein
MVAQGYNELRQQIACKRYNRLSLDSFEKLWHALISLTWCLQNNTFHCKVVSEGKTLPALAPEPTRDFHPQTPGFAFRKNFLPIL